MISSIFDFCQNISIEFNLLELIKGLSALVLIKVIVLTVKRIVSIIKKEREIDERIRKTRDRIARAFIEIKESISEKETEKMTTRITQTLSEVTIETLEETVEETIAIPSNIRDPFCMMANKEETVENARQSIIPTVHEVSVGIPKGKKTRAMSMEERWAEFDRKRAMKNTA